MKHFDGNQKRALIIFIAILLFGMLASCSNVSPATADPPVSSIRVVMDNNYPPYIFLDEQGNAQGILVDQWSLWEKHTGVKVELSAIPWEDALSGMEAGEFDVIDTIFHTDERAKVYDFTDSYVRIDVPIFFNNNISGIANAGDLRGFRVAVKAGDADAKYLIDAGITDLVYYNSYEEIIRAAERKEETIFVIDQPPGLYFLYKYGLQNQFNYSAPLFSGEFHRAVKKGDTALLNLVTSGFASISKSEYQAIDNRWLGIQQNNNWQEYLPYLQVGAIIAFLAICILLVFNRTLQRRVGQRTRELNEALTGLQKSERKYREIFNATTEAIFIHAVPGGELLHVNESMLRMYGYESEEEVLSKNVNDLSASQPPYTELEAQEKMRKALEKGPQVFEWLAKKKNGEPFWVEVSLRSSQIGGEGKILAVVRDITKRKRTEEALRVSEAQYEQVISMISDIIWRYEVDAEGQFVGSYISPVADRVLGQPTGTIGNSFDKYFSYIHPEDFPAVQETFALALAEKAQNAATEYRLCKPDGTILWVRSNGLAYFQPDGHFVAFGTTSVITERRQAEEALRESESLLREAQMVADMGSYVLDFNSGMWKSSAILDKLFGIDDSYVRSVEGWSGLIHPDHRQQMTDYFTNEVMGRHTRFDREYKIIRKNDKAERWVHGLGNLEVDTQNKLLKMHGVIQDITVRKQAEEAIQNINILLEQTLEQSPVPMVLVSMPDGIIRSANSACRHFLGIEDETIPVGTLLSELKPSWQAFNMQGNPAGTFEELPLPRSLRGLKTDVQEQRIIRKDGTSVYGLVYGSPIFDTAGKVIAGYLVMIDITERKQAEQDIHQRIMELEMLYESGLAINQLLDPREIGQKVIELLEQKLGWHHATVRLYHPQDESLELLAFNQPGLKSEAERREVEERFKTLVASTAQGLSGWAVLHGQLIRSNDLRNDARYVDTYPGLQSGLYVPMKLGDRVVGVISIESEQPNAFSAADERLAATLANQAASALENARLFEAERKQREMSDALRDALSAGASMSASLDFETILDRLLEALERVVPFEGGSIMLVVQPKKQKVKIARVRGYKKLGQQVVENILKLSFDVAFVETLRWMFNKKQPLVISDIEQYPGWIRYPETSYVRSWAGAPIILNNEVIAMFSLDSTEPNFFRNEQIELLSAFTGQASLALQNARLFEETARRAQEFAALYEISNSLSADNDLNTLLKDIVEHATTLLGTSTGAMYLRNRTNDNLEIVITTTPAISIGTTLRPGEGMAGRVAQTHQPMRIENYSTWEGRLHIYDDVLFRANLEVPILFGGDLIGVLDVAEVGDSSRTFTESDERLLSLFAAQAAGAIHSARLREETARRAREFAALYETSNALSTESELNAMLQVIVEHARKLLDSASSGMYLYLSETNELELTVDTTSYELLGTRLQLGEGVAGRVAQTRQSVRVDEYSTWEGRSLQYEGSTIRAVLEVPMLYRGELIGVLTADEINDSKRKFTEADERLLSLFASQAAGVIHSARLREQTARRLDQLQALHIIDRAISSSFDLRPILNTVISQTIAQLGVDAVDVLLFHPHLQTLEYVAGQGFHTRAIEQTHLRLGEGLAGRAAFERRTLHVPNLPETGSNFTRASLLEGESFLEYYTVPLIAKGEIKGVLEVFHRASLPRDPEWLDFLETLAGQAAITIDQTQLFEDLQRANLELIIAYDATIEGWARAMDLRDKETENHTRRVTEMTLSLAKALGIKDSEALHIRRGALLHDIGKMGVPDNVLLKGGELTEEEWTLMRRHPQFAYEMLQPIKYLRQSLDIPYSHHEKWDGTGYPHGLIGEQIPLAARIFAIVDVWDALTSDRPYRKGWSKQKALKHIREQSGKQFDPRVVDAFLEIFGNENS